jgi:hypothetical protein
MPEAKFNLYYEMPEGGGNIPLTCTWAEATAEGRKFARKFSDAYVCVTSTVVNVKLFERTPKRYR